MRGVSMDRAREQQFDGGEGIGERESGPFCSTSLERRPHRPGYVANGNAHGAQGGLGRPGRFLEGENVKVHIQIAEKWREP